MRNHMWGHLFHSITEFWIHQNELMWSRMKVLFVIEGFILTSAYTIEDKANIANFFTLALFLVGFIITSAIFVIVLRDLKYREIFHDMLEDIPRRAKSHFIFNVRIEDKKMIAWPEIMKEITGTRILKALCVIFSAINIFLAACWFFALKEHKTILIFISRL